MLTASTYFCSQQSMTAEIEEEFLAIGSDALLYSIILITTELINCLIQHILTLTYALCHIIA